MMRRLLTHSLVVGCLIAGQFVGFPGSAQAAEPAAGCGDTAAENSAARVRKGSGAKEPALHNKSDANAYGVIKDSPLMPPGSVTINTVFHVITATQPSAARKAKLQQMVTDQVTVLNDSFAGDTASVGVDSPFRFALTKVNWVVNASWATVSPGKTELAMKQTLREGDSKTLNVYTADIGGGLLGWATFPKGFNNGQDYRDGVVILDESMPGGNTGIYSGGDTLTHEVGHWMGLYHTFQGACSASGDFVSDTPREAVPQFDCGVFDTCPTAGNDPVTNFMDYTEDACMDRFTQGQIDRMNDAWLYFRA